MKCGPTRKKVPCKVDCKLTGFSEWGECSKTCGGGVRRRFRTVRFVNRNGGEPCLGSKEEGEPCNTQPCRK